MNNTKKNSHHLPRLDAEQAALCEGLEKAIHGGIPFDRLPNHGINSTESSEAAARSRLAKHIKSPLADFINDL